MIDELDLSKFEGHTPVPWKCVPGDSIVSVRAEAGTNICATTSKFYWQKADQLEASNAALIAAAPALLAEVKRLRAWRDCLREPTPEMIEASINAMWTGNEVVYADGFESAEDMVQAGLRAMLDAAAAAPLTPEEIEACTEIWAPKHARRSGEVT